MNRIVLFTFFVVLIGCSGQPSDHVANQKRTTEIEDGGRMVNLDREKAEAYFLALGETRSIDQEKQLLTEFGRWLSNKGYSIRVEEKNGAHQLSCPFFPPVTPWTDHTFLDVKNLDLLPQIVERD